MKNKLTIKDMQIISAIAKHGKLNAAGDSLGIAQSNISKYLGDIEKKLRIAIFDRSSKFVKPTQEGNFVIKKINECLKEIDALNISIDNIAEGNNRFISIYAPTTTCISIAKDIIPLINKGHTPSISVNVYTPVAGDIYRGCIFPDDCDILLSYTPPQSEDLVSKKLFNFSFRAYATPIFLGKNRLNSPFDLEKKNCILIKNFLLGDENKLNIKNLKNGQNSEVTVHGNYICDSSLVAIELAKQHLGIIFSHKSLVQQHLNDGVLLPCLPEEYIIESSLYMITKPNKLRPKSVKSLIDNIVDIMSSFYKSGALE